MANGEWRMGREAQRPVCRNRAACAERAATPGERRSDAGFSHSPFAIRHSLPFPPFANRQSPRS
ncbi:MAG: hypothetical protein LW860_18600 [Xanthomonadaceae bacterium]|nr:hypothetical protein [Xanthomonadaceae bacterium]